MHKELNRQGFYYGFPVLLATTKDKNANDDITVLSSSWTLGNTVVLGIGIENQGFKNIKNGSDITLNLCDEGLLEAVQKMEKLTGDSDVPEEKKNLGYTYEHDKFKVANLSKEPSINAKTVRIKECKIQIETVVEKIELKEWFSIVTCKITGIFVDENLLKDEKIDTQKWHPLIYKFKEYVGTCERLALNFGFKEI